MCVQEMSDERGLGVAADDDSVVIAEDQALVRRGTALLLSMTPDMECVGQATNGEEAVKLAKLLQPDVILMDLHMPVMGGVAATREIHPPNGSAGLGTDHTGRMMKPCSKPCVRARRPICSKMPARTTCWKPFGRCAVGVASDAADCAQGDGPIQTIGSDRVVRTHVAQPLYERVGPSRAASAHVAPATEELTEKEARVLSLITKGASNREIAQALALAEGTIKNYVSLIMQKLHANTRFELALRSRENSAHEFCHFSLNPRASCRSNAEFIPMSLPSYV